MIITWSLQGVELLMAWSVAMSVISKRAVVYVGWLCGGNEVDGCMLKANNIR